MNGTATSIVPLDEKRIPLKIISVYFIGAALWILLSDRLLLALVGDVEVLTSLQNIKGWLFVAVTAGLLYWQIRRDIAAIRRSEQALRESEARLQTAMENLPFDFWACDVDGRFVLQNPVAVQHWGDLRGVRPDEIDLPQDVGSLWQSNNRRALTGEVVQGEVEYLLAGERRVYENIIAPIRDGERISGILGVNIDITERKRAGAAEREQRALAEALRDTAAALNSTLDFNEVLDRVLDNVGRVVAHDAANIALVDAGVTHVVRCRGYSSIAPGLEEMTLAIHFRVADVPGLRQMAETGQSRAITDTATDAIWVDHPATRWVKSYAGAPIHVKGQTVGFLNLNSATPGFFASTHAERLLAFADQAAIAIENARLFEETHRRARRLALINEISIAINLPLELGAVLQAAVDGLARAIDVSQTGLALFDETRESLSVAAEHAVPGVPAAIGVRLPVEGNPSMERILATRAPLAIADAQNDPLLANVRDVMVRRSVQSILIVPLIVRDEIIGTIACDAVRAPRRFTTEEIELAQTIANLVSARIEQARLFEAERARRREVESIAVHNAALHDQAQRHAAEMEQRVTDRTAELRGERERMLAILEAAGEGIVLIDRDWITQYVNPAMEQLTGYPAAELMGQTPRLWESRLTPHATLEDLQRRIERGEAWRGEVVSQRSDGASYDTALTITPLKDSDGRLAGFVCTQRDISHLKEVDRLKDQFVSSVSHELRTPLANVKLYLGLLEHGRLDKRDLYMQTLNRETLRLETLIEDLLDLSRISSPAPDVHFTPTNLNHIAADLIADRSAVAVERGLLLDCEPDLNLPPAMADPALTAQVMSNLMTNAINYTPRGGVVTITTAVRFKDDREWVTFTVLDTGLGISPGEMPRVFDRFFRGKAGLGSGIPGTGLGLSICKEIVDRLGGTITVESELERGAAFTVWLRSV